MLAHSLRRWANISPVWGYCVVFGATLNVSQRHRWRTNINPAYQFFTLPPFFGGLTSYIITSQSGPKIGKNTKLKYV